MLFRSTKLARWFNLEFQLDTINYDRPHFVHADLEIGRPLADGEKGTLPKELRGLQQDLDSPDDVAGYTPEN